MATARTKPVTNIIPQNREQAAAAVAEYASIERAIGNLESLMNEEIAKIKHDYFNKALPLRIRKDAVEAGIQAFCEANRDALTENGKTKTVDHGVGKTSWRFSTAKVVINGKEEDLVDYIKRSEDAELQIFLRETFEINRVQVLRHPDMLDKLPGVEIVKGVETFEIKPDKAKIPDAVASEAAE